jgi:hypothetical protein
VIITKEFTDLYPGYEKGTKLDNAIFAKAHGVTKPVFTVLTNLNNEEVIIEFSAEREQRLRETIYDRVESEHHKLLNNIKNESCSTKEDTLKILELDSSKCIFQTASKYMLQAVVLRGFYLTAKQLQMDDIRYRFSSVKEIEDFFNQEDRAHRFIKEIEERQSGFLKDF